MGIYKMAEVVYGIYIKSLIQTGLIDSKYVEKMMALLNNQKGTQLSHPHPILNGQEVMQSEF